MYGGTQAQDDELALLKHRLRVALRRLDNKDLEVRTTTIID